MIHNNPSPSSPFVGHESTRKASSELAQASSSLPLITHLKISGLSSEKIQGIQSIAEASLLNKKEMDSLAQSIHSAKLKMKSLEEKEKGNKNGNSTKLNLQKEIRKIAQAEEDIKEKIFNISKDIHLLEKKQDQRARKAKEREGALRKHLIDVEALLKDKGSLEAVKSVLSKEQLALQSGIEEKKGDIKSLEIQKKSIGESIEALFDGKACEEMVKASTILLEKHGMKLPPEGNIEGLAEFLYKATDHSMSKEEQIKSAENKYLNIRSDIYAGAIFIIGYILTSGFISQHPDEKKLYNLSVKERRTLTSLAVFLAAVAALKLLNILQSKELDKIRGEGDFPRRTIKRGVVDRIVNPKKVAEEELFKLAFGLAQHANIKLIKSPLEAMIKEVTRLVMDARMNGQKLIKKDAVKKGDIQEYLSRLKNAMNREISRLEKNLDKEIDKIAAKQNKNGRKNDKKEFGDLSEKVDFVRDLLIDNETKSPINNEAKVVCDVADKAKFINEFSKMFNVKNEDVLIDAVSNVIIGMSQEMMNKLSAADNVSIEELDPSSLERSIKDAEQEKKKLENILLESNESLQVIDLENEKIKKEIDDIQTKIVDKKKNLAELKQAMEKTPLGQDKLKGFEPEFNKLSQAGINIKTQEEYAGYTSEKIKNIKGGKERLANLLTEHDKLYEKYSRLEAEKKKREDQLERIEFLEARASGKDEKIKKIQDDIEEFQTKLDKLKSTEGALLKNLEKQGLLSEILTPQAIKRVKNKHLAQSEDDLKEHAKEYGYSSNYKSVGHFLTACLDIHESLQKNIASSRESELYGYFVKSDTDIADGMDWQYRKTPISASVANIIVKPTDQGEKKYLIDHVYGYVPRHWHAEK